MAQAAVADGVTGICCTPHTLNGCFVNDADTVRAMCRRLQERLDREKVSLTLYPGAEVHITADTLASITDKRSLTLNDTGRYVLLEPPPMELPPDLPDLVFQLTLRGITPILAHPERVQSVLVNLHQLYPLVEAGMLCQVTTLSVTGDFGPQVQEAARTMICCNLAHIIAGDAHSVIGRPPQLSEAVEQAAAWLGGMEQALSFCDHTPRAVIAGERISPPPPVMPQRRGVLHSIRRFFMA